MNSCRSINPNKDVWIPLEEGVLYEKQPEEKTMLHDIESHDDFEPTTTDQQMVSVKSDKVKWKREQKTLQQ